MYFFHIVVCFSCSVSCFSDRWSRSFAAVSAAGRPIGAIESGKLGTVFPHSIIPTAKVRRPVCDEGEGRCGVAMCRLLPVGAVFTSFLVCHKR